VLVANCYTKLTTQKSQCRSVVLSSFYFLEETDKRRNVTALARQLVCAGDLNTKLGRREKSKDKANNRGYEKNETFASNTHTRYNVITMVSALSPEIVPTPPLPQPPTLKPTTPHLISPTLVTTDMDLLRFHAYAHTQLQSPAPTTIHNQTASSQLLISSPYNTPGHHLDLTSPSLHPESRLLALALTFLQPTSASYATSPYTSALNFERVVDFLRTLVAQCGIHWQEKRFYVVTFHSQLKKSVDLEYLYKLDAESHKEACESGGLLKYWFGKGDGERRNLATCKSSPLFGAKRALGLICGDRFLAE
jgi:hypothetical protein